MTTTIDISAAFKSTSPKLSVLVPFYKDDASTLLQDLDVQIIGQPIEVLFYDDGTGDPALTAQMREHVGAAKGAVKLITNSANQGRSGARNGLFDAARADWVLFLDADMRPSREDFLGNYLHLIETDGADVLFGGFEVEDHQADRDLSLIHI